LSFNSPKNNEELAARLDRPRTGVAHLGRLHGEGLIEIRRRTVIRSQPCSLKEDLTPSDYFAEFVTKVIVSSAESFYSAHRDKLLWLM